MRRRQVLLCDGRGGAGAAASIPASLPPPLLASASAAPAGATGSASPVMLSRRRGGGVVNDRNGRPPLDSLPAVGSPPAVPWELELSRAWRTASMARRVAAACSCSIARTSMRGAAAAVAPTAAAVEADGAAPTSGADSARRMGCARYPRNGVRVGRSVSPWSCAPRTSDGDDSSALKVVCAVLCVCRRATVEGAAAAAAVTGAGAGAGAKGGVADPPARGSPPLVEEEVQAPIVYLFCWCSCQTLPSAPCYVPDSIKITPTIQHNRQILQQKLQTHIKVSPLPQPILRSLPPSNFTVYPYRCLPRVRWCRFLPPPLSSPKLPAAPTAG